MTAVGEATTAVPARWAASLRSSLPRMVFIGPLLAYLLLTLTGITTSSIGVDFLREDPSTPGGTQIGSAQSIRGDEYATESPLWLGQIARSGETAWTPLSVPDDLFGQIPIGPASAIVFFDGTMLGLGGSVPDEMLFAAKWWLPTLMLFLGLPVLFRQMTGQLRWGYLASVLIVVAPATAWWSGRPVNTLGFTAAGCALAVYAARQLPQRHWMKFAAAVAGAGILLARMPTYYQPLAIIIGLPLVIATAALILSNREIRVRERWLSLVAVGVSGLTWTALLFWENRETVVAGLSTVYPGDRKSTGTALDPGMIFGATNLSFLEQRAAEHAVNQSELVTAFTILLPVVALLLIARRLIARREVVIAVTVLAVFGVFWLSWATVSWGAVGEAIPLINRVPDHRAAQGVGFIAIIAFCLLMTQWDERPGLRVPALVGAVAAGLSAYAGSWLQETALPGMPTLVLWLSAAITGATVFALVRWPTRWWPLAVAGVAASLITVTAQPILVGLGDLRTSSAAQKFVSWGQESRERGEVWASESQFVDALMMATGTPALSTRQQVGPDVGAWEELDPDRQFEEMWNRGGLHVQFEWNESETIEFIQPYPDVVIMRTSPCTVAERIPEFSFAISEHPLSARCLQERDSFTWSGIDYQVYRVVPAGLVG